MDLGTGRLNIGLSTSHSGHGKTMLVLPHHPGIIQLIQAPPSDVSCFKHLFTHLLYSYSYIKL